MTNRKSVEWNISNWIRCLSIFILVCSMLAVTDAATTARAARATRAANTATRAPNTATRQPNTATRAARITAVVTTSMPTTPITVPPSSLSVAAVLGPILGLAAIASIIIAFIACNLAEPTTVLGINTEVDAATHEEKNTIGAQSNTV